MTVLEKVRVKYDEKETNKERNRKIENENFAVGRWPVRLFAFSYFFFISIFLVGSVVGFSSQDE